MTTKLKIDLSLGILEVEGTEAFVRAIYNDFKVQFLGEEAVELDVAGRRRRRTARQAEEPSEAEAAPVEPAPPAEPSKTEPTHRYLEHLDLSAGPDRPSLVDFMDSKFPVTNDERNLVFVYYLQYLLKEKSITPDHVYTCYREAKIRAPIDMEKSLRLTAQQRRWVRVTKTGKVSVTPLGRRYLEHELPKKMKV
ncbi:MAG: hypothetical protein D6784_18115 [Chloroflexi bacterium]|nr:MAG: hypothetical protein D6784_18115 [Chloroflexota bacterium]